MISARSAGGQNRVAQVAIASNCASVSKSVNPSRTLPIRTQPGRILAARSCSMLLVLPCCSSPCFSLFAAEHRAPYGAICEFRERPADCVVFVERLVSRRLGFKCRNLDIQMSEENCSFCGLPKCGEDGVSLCQCQQPPLIGIGELCLTWFAGLIPAVFIVGVSGKVVVAIVVSVLVWTGMLWGLLHSVPKLKRAPLILCYVFGFVLLPASVFLLLCGGVAL